jgi:hypothetical protein
MPSNQTAKSGGKGGATQARKAPASEPAPRGQSRGQTGERDENYALISVLYHALQGAETIDQYVRDAQSAGDEELASFFEETKEAYAERASEAKALLASRLESMEEDEEDDEEEDEEEDAED